MRAGTLRSLLVWLDDVLDDCQLAQKLSFCKDELIATNSSR